MVTNSKLALMGTTSKRRLVLARVAYKVNIRQKLQVADRATE